MKENVGMRRTNRVLMALLGAALALAPAARADEPAPRLAQDEVVVHARMRLRAVRPPRVAPARAAAAGPMGEIPGLLRATVGFVVPIPGTEMIRVGVVQEGATLQAANRAPGLEGLGREGVVQANAATITVIIRRPAGS